MRSEPETARDAGKACTAKMCLYMPGLKFNCKGIYSTAKSFLCTCLVSSTIVKAFIPPRSLLEYLAFKNESGVDGKRLRPRQGRETKAVLALHLVGSLDLAIESLS
jgi:hypothetical protein